MGQRIFTLFLVVVIGVFVGVGIVTRQARDPLLRELLEKQGALLKNQEKLEKNLSSGGSQGNAGMGQYTNLLQAQQNLENRIAGLERKMNVIESALRGGNNANNVQQAPPPENLAQVYEIPAGHTPVKGNTNAPVTIVEFVDFQCPFCSRFHPPVQEVLKAYPKQVKYMVKNFPLNFHPEARPAAKVAFAAGEQGKYWAMVDALLENQRDLSQEKYNQLARDLGLNMKKFEKDLKEKDAQWEEYIKQDITLGTKVNVRGTPTFYINGKKTNARDFDSLKSEIDQILNN